MPNNKNIEEILESFDNRFNGKIKIDNRQGFYNNPIKNFIKQSLLTLQSKHEEEIKRIAKDVIGEKAKHTDFYCYNTEGNIRMEDGYNQKRDKDKEYFQSLGVEV